GARLSGEAGVATFDVFGFGTQVAADPAAFGITNVADACGAVAGANCSQYLYWDGIHPSTAAHALISSSMLQVVAIPEPASMLLMAVGLAGLVTVRRRRA
ncbi:MAG TPA: PEP-CTERM sorting domain-containing protein, partial [Rubrivivax sp.]|nr:PEP-CTERM sorting domain-containing protein [Rubrivivax sp.]